MRGDETQMCLGSQLNANYSVVISQVSGNVNRYQNKSFGGYTWYATPCYTLSAVSNCY